MNDPLNFTAIEVENIFAYSGLSRIDLSDCTDDCNVIVVSGQNGVGKTSLLNAIKLLFLGSASEAMRRVGFGGGVLNSKNYVNGQTGRWYGVFNKAMNASDVHARVSLEWTSGSKAFKAQRTFKRGMSALDFFEELVVSVDGQPLSPAASEELVAKIAPNEVVPFYFFDGEQVQSFADAEEGRERTEIERLLGLSFVPELIRELEALAKAKRRTGLPENVKLAIVLAENQYRDSTARKEAANRSRIQVEEELMDLQRQRDRLNRDRDALRIGISQTDRNRMVSRISFLGNQRELLRAELSEQLPSEAPWLANLDLVRETFVVLEKHLSGSIDASVTGKLHSELPGDLIQLLTSLQPPVDLDTGQKRAFSDGIHEALTAQGVSINAFANPLLASLGPRQIRVLRDQYHIWAEGGERLVASQAEKLRQLRQISGDRNQAQRDLDEAELTTDEARQRFELLSIELTDLDVRLRELADRAAEFRKDEAQAQRDAETSLDSMRLSEGRYAEVARDNKEYQLCLKVKRALESYREMRRMEIRGSVEKRLNMRIGILLGPSQLIKTVTLDDKFVMKYFDDRDQEVARRSISAGMRQLVAMAMLWALKDEARRELPVMIDTPLGRIDQQNRTLLMTEYFPNAGKPLVLLPTDTEIGKESFDHLRGRIRRKYEIQNFGGLQAKIVQTHGAVS